MTKTVQRLKAYLHPLQLSLEAIAIGEMFLLKLFEVFQQESGLCGVVAILLQFGNDPPLRLDGSFTHCNVLLDKCQTLNEGETIHVG